MKTITWNDGRKPGGRYPRLAFIKDGIIYPFCGESIPEVAVVTASQYEKSGQWSNTTYEILISENIGVFDCINPLHGKVFEKCHNWNEALSDFINRCGKIVTVEEFKTYLQKTYPKVTERLNKVDELTKILDLDQKIDVSFGSPTNRSISEGWWSSPKNTIIGEMKLKEDSNNKNLAWNYCEIDDIEPPANYKVIDIRRSPGMHGGYVTIVLAPKI